MEGFQTFLTSDKIYKPSEILDVLKMVRHYFRFSFCNKKQKYFNVPCAFDIETSSFYANGEIKTAIVYEWTFGIYGAVIIGRTRQEFIEMLETLAYALDLNEKKRLIIYVHNLSYEFQFIRKHFIWDKVFALDNRKVIYALTADGIEFRCSYLLSGYPLAKLADQLQTAKIQKLVGDLDYELVRHEKTPLTEAELAYCVNDVKIVLAYIAEKIDQDGGIARIPLTKTGYVRNFCREMCFYEPGKSKKKSFKRLNYVSRIKGLTLDVAEYRQQKRGFQGGFVHANPFYSGKVVQNVTSFDFTSSYPTVMVAEMFPMSAPEMVDIKSAEEMRKDLRLYCCIFDIEFIGLESKVYFESYLSESRCWAKERPVVNNGRIVSADRLCTTITEQDFFIIEKMYSWQKMRVSNFRRFKKDYLPTDFVKAILKLYKDKTELKGVDGKEVEYLNSKEMLNSCYGMAVTDIVRLEYIYEDGEWQEPRIPDIEESLNKYNKSPSRFLYYPWGVWVTAYARRNLFSGILEFAEDYVYSDTDSVKAINADKHMEYINKYNSAIQQKIRTALEYHGIDETVAEPVTIEGIKKPLGVWDFDGEYEMFKTLGAKRYMVKYSSDPMNGKKAGTFNITVAGLNKQVCVPWLLKTYGENRIFDAFTSELYVPPEYTGKNTHTYIDTERTGTVVDHLGNAADYHELTAVHLEAAEYSLKLSKEYLDFLLNIETLEM